MNLTLNNVNLNMDLQVDLIMNLNVKSSNGCGFALIDLPNKVTYHSLECEKAAMDLRIISGSEVGKEVLICRCSKECLEYKAMCVPPMAVSLNLYQCYGCPRWTLFWL